MRFKVKHTFPLLCLVIYGLLLLCRSATVRGTIAGGDYLVQIILQFLIFLIPSIIYCRLRGQNYAAQLNLRPVGPASIGITLLCILLMIAGSWLIRMAQLTLLMGDASISFSASYPVQVADFSDGLYATLTFAVFPAICEEFVFRSVLYTEYTRAGYGFLTVGVLSALFFAMMHFDAAQFPIYLWCGVVLIMLTYITQSVFPAMICHFAYNMYGIFGETYLLNLFTHPQNTVFLLFAIAVIFLLLVIFTLGEAERIFTVYGSCDRETPPYAVARAKEYPKFGARMLHGAGAFASPLTILCAVLFLMMTFATGS